MLLILEQKNGGTAWAAKTEVKSERKKRPVGSRSSRLATLPLETWGGSPVGLWPAACTACGPQVPAPLCFLCPEPAKGQVSSFLLKEEFKRQQGVGRFGEQNKAEALSVLILRGFMNPAVI